MKNIFEEKWFEAKDKSVGEFVAFIKKAPAVLKKYKFEKLQSDIISKLLKSNDNFWFNIEQETEVFRRKRTVIKDIEEKVNSLTEKIIAEKSAETPNQERLDFLTGELEYIGDNFEPDTNTLITYEEVNKDYTDSELVFFFVEFAEKLDIFIENTMDKEGLFSKDELFLEYLTRLFAYHINDMGIELGEDTIKLKTVVDDEDIAAVNELNEINKED